MTDHELEAIERFFDVVAEHILDRHFRKNVGMLEVTLARLRS